MAAKKHKTADLSQPVTIKPIPANRLAELLAEAAARLHPASAGRRARSVQVRYNALMDADRRFNGVLDNAGIAEVEIDEALLATFDDSLAEDDVSEEQRRIYRSSLRKMVNRLPKQYLRRDLATLRQIHRANRFDAYSPATAEALEERYLVGRTMFAVSKNELVDWGEGLSRSLNYVINEHRASQVRKILLCGSAAHTCNLAEFLSDEFDFPVELLTHPLLDQITALLPSSRSCSGTWSTALGLAIPREAN